MSRVLNSKSTAQIAPTTRERVERAAAELSYHPSAVARALVRQQSDTFGVLLPPTPTSPLRHPHFSALLDGVLEAATESEMDVMVFTAHPSGTDQAYLAKLTDGRCDGLLMFFQPPDSGLIPMLLERNAPCILVGDWREDPRLPCVDVENFEAMRQMTQYLLGLGHRRIALLSSEKQFYYIPPRLAGFRQAFLEHGAAAEESLIFTGALPWDAMTVAGPVNAMLALPAEKRPTAVCCTSDDIASLVTTTLHQRGVRVPEDMSVTGFNDDAFAIRQHPTLTSMRQPYEAIGASAIAMLQERLRDPSAPAKKLELPAELIVRGSTGPPP